MEIGEFMRVKQVVISFWYKEMEYNPISKVGMLEKELNNYFKAPFLINDKEPFINIGFPRIIAQGHDKKSIFNMTLVNANLNINYNNEVDIDDILLEINEKIQFLYDALKSIYELEILYASIKIETTNEVFNVLDLQKELINEKNNDIEDFTIKKTYKKDDKYYLNITKMLTKEVNIDIKLPKNIQINEGDMITRSMLVSLEDGKVVGDILNNLFEVNNRLGYNNNSNYRVTKDEIRDLIFEFKMLINKEIKEKE